MRKLLVLAAVPILLLAACKSSSDGASSPATTAPAVTVDTRAPGVTDDTIKVGITYVDLSALKDVIGIDHGDYETAYTAAIDAVNAKGGVHGRMLEPIIVPVDPQGEASADAACTTLTQDDPTFVTMGFFQEDTVLCYVDTNDTAVIGGTMTEERLAKAKAPWYSTEPGQDLEGDVVRTLAENGELSGKVAVVANASEQKLMDETVLPALAAAGIDPVETAVIDAPLTDAAATVAAAQTIAERFKAAEAEKVLVVGNAAVAFGRGLARTDFRPGLVFDTLEAANTYGQDKTNDLTILDGAVSGGRFGPGATRLALDDQLTKDCIATQRAAGLTIVAPDVAIAADEPDQFQSSQNACLNVALLMAILEKAGPELNYGTFRTAGDSLGAIDLPTYPAGTWNFGAPPSADGDPEVFAFVYDPAKLDFVLAEN